jgi:hypothetical protein
MDQVFWEEVGPGRYERPIDTIESFYASPASTGEMPEQIRWLITSVIELECGSESSPSIDLAENLRKAWVTIRYRFPSLAVNLENKKNIYIIGDDIEIDDWLQETFVVCGSNTEEYLAESTPPKRVTLVFFPYSNELMIRGPHWRLDGVGALLLFHNLLELLVSPVPVKFGDEAKNLNIPLGRAANIPAPSADDAAITQEAVSEYGQALPSIGLPYRSDNATPGPSSHARVIFSKIDTAKVVAGAKAKNFTVTQAIHAAVIRAVAKLGKREGTYATWGWFNLRGRCGSLGNNPGTVYHTGWPTVIHSSPYVETAKQLKNFYGSNMATTMQVQRVAVLFDMELPQTSLPSEPFISSIGITDRWLHREYSSGIKLRDWWITVDETTPQVNTLIWTFRDQISLSGSYSTTYYEKEDIFRYLDVIRDELVAGLEIDRSIKLSRV